MCGTFSRIDHMLGHKTSLSKFKKIEIISSIFSDHNGMKLETNYKKKAKINMWKQQHATDTTIGSTKKSEEKPKNT